MPTPLLEFKSVKFSYTKNTRPLLDIDNFVLDLGQRIGIVGDNGSGKTTMAKLLLGIYKPQERSDLRLFGQKVAWGNHYPSLGYIGDPSHTAEELGLPTDISVRELIDSFKGLASDTLDEVLCEKIEEKLNLAKLYSSNVGNLSKGERLKLMVFLALGKKPRLLIADEPTEGLDRESKEVVFSLMRDTLKREEVGMLWISHRYHEMMTLVDDIYELSKGKLKYIGTGSESQFELEVNQKNYEDNISSDSIFETLGKVIIDPSTLNFRLTGCRIQQGEQAS